MRIDSSRTRRDRTPFIGRRQEREALHAALERGTGLISLTGPSGIGKTRLALQAAAESFEVYRDEGGAWFCSLAGCRDTADLEVAVARTLEIQQQQGDALARSIANRGPLLLLLDNADPIANEIGGVLRRWLGRCVELQLLLTSLVPAGVPEELVLELRPLEPDDAVDLYLDRAHRAWADRTFSLDDAEVQELVRRLDQLPLAIELAAARVRILPPKAMLSMFEKRFELLRTTQAQPSPNRSGPPPRRGSLFGALELTWSHLEPDEQLALARGAVFEGGFTADAASAVLLDRPPSPRETEGGRASEIRPILDALHRRSLLLLEELDPPRYYLMESVKEFALRELRDKGRWEDAVQRHASFYLGKSDDRPARFAKVEPTHSIPWLKRERENLLAIHDRFLASHPVFAARAGIALAPLIFLEGQSSSQAELIEATLDAARRSQHPKLIIDALEITYVSHFRHGRFDEAKAEMEEVVKLARATGDKAVEAYTLSRIAILALDQRSVEASHAPLRRAIELSEALGLPALEGAILLVQGGEAIERDALDEAEAHLVRSVELLRRHGSYGSEVNSLYNLGLTLANQRKHRQAQQVMREAIEVSRRFQKRAFEAHVRLNLAKLDLAAGLLDEAEAGGEASLAIQRGLGVPYREGIVFSTLGAISLERGELDAADERLSRAEELLRDNDPTDARPKVLIFLSVLESKRQQLAEARRLLTEAYRAREASTSHSAEGIGEFALLFEGAEGLFEIAAAKQLEGLEWPLAEARIERARARLSKLEGGAVSWPSFLPVFPRLLRKELAGWDAGTPLQEQRSHAPVLRIGAGMEWFQLTGRERVSLQSRPLIQRLFAELLRARLETPGLVVDPQALIRAGWPDVRRLEDFSLNRVHYGVWTLRDLGLRTVVQNTPAGYRLDPSLRVHLES